MKNNKLEMLNRNIKNLRYYCVIVALEKELYNDVDYYMRMKKSGHSVGAM